MKRDGLTPIEKVILSLKLQVLQLEDILRQLKKLLEKQEDEQ